MPDSLSNTQATASNALGASALDRPLAMTFFEGAAADRKHPRTLSLRAIIPNLRDTRAADKAALPWVKLATFGEAQSLRGSFRHDANMIEINGIEADYDGEDITLERARRILGNADVAAILYTSPSHRADAPRWRVLCPTSESLPPADRARLMARVNGLFLGALAAESFTLSQSYYFGALHGSTAHEVIPVEGRAIDLCPDLDGEAIGRPERKKAEPTPAPAYAAPFRYDGDGSRYGVSAMEAECNAIRNAGEGGKHHALNKAAYSIGGLVSGGHLAEAPAFAALSGALADIRHRCEDYGHAQRTLRKAFDDGKAAPREVAERQAAPQRDPFGIMSRQTFSIDPETGEVLPGKPEGPVSPLPLIFFEDIKANLDAADFVEGLLIETAMSVVYGPSNCGKTFFMTDLAMHVATGRAWRGKEIEPGGVVYCALEGGHGISNRIAAFKREHGPEGVEVPFAVVPVAINLLDPNADRERLVEAVKAAAEHMGVPVKLIVIDTLSRALAGGNENAPDDMGALVASADYIRQALKAHICFIHHSGKDQAQGARGHSLLRAATDTEIEISRADNDSPSVAKVTKQRELEIEGNFVFTLRQVELGKNRRGKPVTSCVVEASDAAVSACPARIPEGARIAFDALCEAIIASGTTAGHSGTSAGHLRDIPPNVRAVPVDLWRQEFYARSHADSPEAKRKAFQRAVSALRSAGQVAVFNDKAWLTEEATRT